MSVKTGKFELFREKMEREGLPEIAVRTFQYYYDQLVSGQTGHILESDITPIRAFPALEEIPDRTFDIGRSAMSHAVMIKVNGGLGTSMGLEKPKSLLKVKDGLTFLDIIARQALHSKVPLILMNSFATREASLEALEKYPELHRDFPLDFMQHKIPKVAQSDFSPVSWPLNPALEWCPPGHGDIYSALVTSGILGTLLQKGYYYAFLSNVDNLGAVINERILGYMVENEIPFLSEVIERAEADKKGGHIAVVEDGRLILRETAQCTPEDLMTFQDVSLHRFFNANNLWVDLRALQRLMKEKDHILGLTLIRNSKTVDPRDPTSTPVFQLETAMGSAIGVFEGSGALQVPRTRFSPVKTTNDLFTVNSDAYILTPGFQIQLNPRRAVLLPPLVDLDPAYYRYFDQLEERCPHGSPSLLECESIYVKGDIRFGRDIVLRGEVSLVNETAESVHIADESVLSGDMHWWNDPAGVPGYSRKERGNQ